MSGPTENILLIITDRPGQALSWAKQRYADDPVSVLCLDPDAQDEPLPESWRRLPLAELLDEEALRSDFLALVDAWPRQPLLKEKSFEQMFRRPDGYSLWWTGPGIERHPDIGIFPKLRTLWICDRAIRSLSPTRILIQTRQAGLARSLASRSCREGCPYEFLPDSANPRPNPCGGQLLWLLGSFVSLVWFPWWILSRAACVRLLARTPRETCRQRKTPAVVFASPWIDYRIDQGRVVLGRWRELWDALGRTDAELRCRYLGRNLGRVFDVPARRWRRRLSVRYWYHVLRRHVTDWRLLRRVERAVPLAESHLACGAWLRSVPAQLAATFRYARLERSAAFRQSLVFAGADVCHLYVPLLRRAIGQLAEWSHAVACIVKSLRVVGNLKALVLTEEMYPIGMLHIAAARRLGIPSIGMQHGTIFPMHLIYTLPPGQLEGAPAPDYFAAYGQHAKQTVSVHGAFPADRVWLAAEPRFDYLVKQPPDAAAARRNLGLPQQKRIVLVATQFYPWFQKVAKAIFEAAKDHEDYLVCLKTHPVDVPLDVYRGIARQVGAENVRFFRDRFAELLAACDVLVSGSSTTIFEAILLGRMTICVNLSDETDRYPYVANGGSLGAGSEEKLHAAMARAFSQQAQHELEAGRQRFLERHAGPMAEGRAAETLAKLIVSLLGDQSVVALNPWGETPCQAPPNGLRTTTDLIP